jgi:hypothetical protein
MTNLINKILNKWRVVGWITPLPTLDRHLEHITGGVAVAAIFAALGMPLIDAAVASTLLFASVEGITAIIRKNYTDCAFDFLQYSFQWFIYLLAVGNYPLALSFIILWGWGYFSMLLEDW